MNVIIDAPEQMCDRKLRCYEMNGCLVEIRFYDRV